MEGGGIEGGREEEGRKETPPQEDKDIKQDGQAVVEAAEDSGVTGGSEEPSDREQSEPKAEDSATQSQPGDSGADSAFIARIYSVQDQSMVPMPPNSSLHNEPLLDSGGEEEEELIVLDPEHPLMKRFQSALKNQLCKELETLNLEMHEKTSIDKAEVSRREELGVELYGVQQELARLQASLEERHETNTQAAAQRRQAQEQVEGVRVQYRNTVGQASKQRTHVGQLQAEIDTLSLRLFYMREVSADLRSDIAAMKNATHKAGSEKTQAEEDKRQQDMYVERLTKQLERLSEQMALYEVQTMAQAEETRAAREALTEAQMEMDWLVVERKQLLQQWNSSLVGMRRRDEAFTAMQDALRDAVHQVRSLDTEIGGFKKSVTKEQERNELLTVLMNRAQLDSGTSRKLIAQSQAQQEALQAQYSTYARTLQETEKTLARLNAEVAMRQSEVSSLRKQLERESAVHVELERRIVTKMQEHLTHDNAAKYSKRLTDKMAALKRERENQLSRLENDIATMVLESNEASQRLEGLGRTLALLEGEIQGRNKLLTAAQAEIDKRVIVIERNQATINVYNKRIQQVIASTGHGDLGPLEIRASTLSKQLEEVGAEIKEQQQFWLWQQGELVRLTQERQSLSSALLTLQTQLTILQQRKVRTEGDIEHEQREQVELERHMKTLMEDMLKLNVLLSQNSHLTQALEQGNALMETGFLHRLKEAERESVEMQMRLEKLQEEKDRLLNSLLEAERQIMLWEKKTQLVRETRSAVDSEVGQGDIRTMRAEIHRMEVRYGQLMKKQEQLLRDMEAGVARRETIVMRGQAQARSDNTAPNLTDLQRTLQGLQRKIQDTLQQAEECELVLRELQESQDSLSSNLKEKQQKRAELHGATSVLTSDLRDLRDSKERNLARLVSLQSRCKQLQAVREGRYTALSSGEAVEPALQHQAERLQAVASILQRLCQEFPQHQEPLRRLTLALAARPRINAAPPQPDGHLETDGGGSGGVAS
ncbi:coiled-coil domain-containing protein 40 [Aplochiton taeniatus]